MFRLTFTALLALIANLIPADEAAVATRAPESLAAPAAAEAQRVEGSAGADISVLSGRSWETWTLTLAAGVPARIVVDGDGSSDLDAYLYDENGNLIDSDTDLSDLCWLDVTPIWTGRFTVKVVNVGHVSNLYSIEIQ